MPTICDPSAASAANSSTHTVAQISAGNSLNHEDPSDKEGRPPIDVFLDAVDANDLAEILM